MKIIKFILLALWYLWALYGIIKNYSNYGIVDWIVVLVIMFLPNIIMGIIAYRANRKNDYDTSTLAVDKFTTTETTEGSDNISSAPSTQYIESDNTIYRTDGKHISDEDIPYLIQVGYEAALQAEKKSSNPKKHRTEREEELCIQFMLGHEKDIQKHTASFEETNRLAYSEKDLNKKIELLQNVIDLYEKEKNWFYRTKGGRIFFQDHYEHMHNSSSEDFSYIDSVKDYLEFNTHKRDFVIPEIIHLITSQGGIMQNNIYKYLPDESKSDIQKIIRELESDNVISRTKRGNTYFLTLTHQ